MVVRLKNFGGILMASGAIFMTVPVATSAAAQDANVEGRVKKLEKEMRAVQRQVFPGSKGRFFEPEITSGDKPKKAQPTTTAVTDLISRVDALEAQLARVTGKVEEQGNSLAKMDARLKKLEAGGVAAAPTTTSSPPSVSAGSSSSSTSASSNPRVQSVAAIERPQSGDAGEDSYIYGYRLWAEKFYPEAQTQLQKTVDKYPKHKRVSHARNLLGRSWLDDKKPNTAAKVFYDNYKKSPRGARAPESLYFLGVALTQLKKKAEACQAFDQLESAYPSESGDRLAKRLASGRARASCK